MRRRILLTGISIALLACLAIILAFPELLITAAMSLYLVPRPATMLLLVVCVVVLLILGLTRRRRTK
jgi:hypothetical protein